MAGMINFLLKPIELLGLMLVCIVAPCGLRRIPIPEEVNLQPSEGYRYSNYVWYDAGKMLAYRSERTGLE